MQRGWFTIAVAITHSLVVAAMSAAEVPPERVAEIARRVGLLLERPFRSEPPVDALTPGEVEQALLADAKARLRALGASEEDAEKAVAAEMFAIAVQGSRLTALYLPGAKRIIIQPRVVDTLVELGVVPAAQRSRVVEPLVGHELVHALQDQEIGLGGFLAVPEEVDPARRRDRESARRAVVEGQAMFIQDLLGRALVAEDSAWAEAVRAAERIAPGALQPEGDPDRYREGLIYRGGAKLVEEHFAKGGAAATWEIFRDPPGDLSALTGVKSLFDAAYSARLASALESEVVAALGPAWRVKAMSASPATALATQLAGLPVERRDALLASVRGLAVLAGGTQVGARVSFVVVVAVDEAAAELVDRELFAMQSTTLDMLGLTAPERTDADTDGLRTSSRREVKAAGDERVAMCFLHGRHELITVQVSVLNEDRDAAALRDFAARTVRAATGVAGPP